jgi:CDP-diacylglycerol---serine O-phosphatidyltransferase
MSKRKINSNTFVLSDYISLSGLMVGWFSILLLFNSMPNLAVIVSMFAFFLDMVDGYVARRLQVDSNKGRYVDSVCDLIIYVLYYFYISPNLIVGAIVSTLIVVFGAARLIRFSVEGIQRSEDRDYYKGITVVHLLFFTIIGYFSYMIRAPYVQYITTFLLVITSFGMLSSYKSYKNTSYWLIGFTIFCVICISTIFKYAYFK